VTPGPQGGFRSWKIREPQGKLELKKLRVGLGDHPCGTLASRVAIKPQGVSW